MDATAQQEAADYFAAQAEQLRQMTEHQLKMAAIQDRIAELIRSTPA